MPETCAGVLKRFSFLREYLVGSFLCQVKEKEEFGKTSVWRTNGWVLTASATPYQAPILLLTSSSSSPLSNTILFSPPSISHTLPPSFSSTDAHSHTTFYKK
ncbi:hypothetical protein CRENBAI_012628 [Crenichthys baileyi]|uniref:Uncharacterized protein n=1 Tax=Crenichthys baileyi TaxID=28760 RepID=A0AAV9SJB0_9TELE